jgi:hypothetical protein
MSQIIKARYAYGTLRRISGKHRPVDFPIVAHHALARSSSGCMASSSDRRKFGAFLERWVSTHTSLSGARSSEINKPCVSGSGTAGPRSKKAQREYRLIIFIDKTGISERPTRVRTWVPKGQTPVIHFYSTGAMCRYSPASAARTICSGRTSILSSTLSARLKRHAIAIFCPDNLGELHTTARNKFKSAQHRPSIIAACWIQASLG